MLNYDSRIALVLGHPGHELRVFNFLEKYKPRVYILTDGSGSDRESRLYQTEKLIRQTGAELSPIAGRFTDREMYRIMREQDIKPVCETIDEIIDDMRANSIDAVAGDSAEGFNPTHDLCRYMINCIVTNYGKLLDKPLPNFEFYLDGPPHICPEGLNDKSIWLRLTDEEFDRKFEACKNYPEIFRDLQELVSKHSREPFKTECLWPVQDINRFKNWATDEPYYEIYGKKRIGENAYEQVITFKDHLEPLAGKLAVYQMAFER